VLSAAGRIALWCSWIFLRIYKVLMPHFSHTVQSRCCVPHLPCQTGRARCRAQHSALSSAAVSEY